MNPEYEQAAAILKEYLKLKGYRSTRERFRVLEEIYSIEDHLNADEIYTRLRNKDVDVSRATVYNTLEVLVECNLVEGHQFGHNHMHYERSYGFRHHDHLICTRCGKIIEVSMPELEMLQDEMCRRLSFRPERHSLQIFGICETCQAAGEAAPKGN